MALGEGRNLPGYGDSGASLAALVTRLDGTQTMRRGRKIRPLLAGDPEAI